MKPKFHPGQVVTHKASGDLAVIENVVYSITNARADGCDWEFKGEYKVSFKFGLETETVNEYLIEGDDDDDDDDDDRLSDSDNEANEHRKFG